MRGRSFTGNGVEEVVGVESPLPLIGGDPGGHFVLDVVEVILQPIVNVLGQNIPQKLALSAARG